MTPKIIVSDADGCMLDWEECFAIWMEHQGFYYTMPTPKATWNMGERFGMGSDEIMAYIKEFNSSAAIGFLPPQRDAQRYVKELHEEHGYKFVIVTSLGDDPRTHRLRERNLKKLFGPSAFERIICLPVGSDKSSVLLELSAKYEGCKWIEDHPKNVDDGVRAGFDGLLFEHKFNMDYSGKAKIVRSWKEIYDLVINNDNKNDKERNCS